MEVVWTHMNQVKTVCVWSDKRQAIAHNLLADRCRLPVRPVWGILPNRPGIESQLQADWMGMRAGSVWTTCTSAHVKPGYRSTRGCRRKCFLLLMIDDFPKKRNAVYLLFLCRLSGVCRANIPIGINS